MARFQEVATDVFVGRYPQWDVNVGVALGGAGALVVDTRAGLRQGREALADLRPLLGSRPVVAVATTHVHFDHSFGAAAFEPVAVYAHETVVDTLPVHADRIRALVREEIALGESVVDGQSYSVDDLSDLLDTPLRLPDVTFERSAVLDLGDRLVRLSFAGRGHTDGDIAVHVEDAGITFLGDLVEESEAPSFGADCFPLDWAATLGRHLEEIPAEGVVVPGHGRPVDVEFVVAQRESLASVASDITEAHAAGLTAAAAAAGCARRLPFPVASLTVAFERGYAAVAATDPR